MAFELAGIGQAADLYVENSAYKGVERIAHVVAGDIELVTGKRPRVMRETEGLGRNVIAVMTLGKSELAEKLGGFPEIAGKREVFQIVCLKDAIPGTDNVLAICGSDKRGTIYGLFQISRMLGVSPWVDWADVKTVRQETVVFTNSIEMISKEPSVRYRGFFINDEWPSFGNWTFAKNGGFTAKMYERLFTLLLRMKGNYLWPAMWSSSFALDGPGMASAELADELGVVMGNSHHEPCLRASEEWDFYKGEDTPYGTAWNYYTNREGLLNYWRDGLKRSGHLDSIITIGMRGERDTSMLGPDATLKENIELLRDIIHEQRKLIAEEVNPEVDKIPQLLALYKEVEAYFYGNDEAKGLIGWEELEHVILLLCEDNYGNMRTLPDEKMRKHPGGYGMYYHFDYHGGPISYEWVNSTPLEKVWEQMTQAYESGVRELWIVNVGDLKPQELPLSYFMELAYDYDTYGIDHPNETGNFLKQWVSTQFGRQTEEAHEEEVVKGICSVLQGYTRLNNLRRPEALSKWTYHLTEQREAGRMLAAADRITKTAEQIRGLLKPEAQDSYTELVYYPAVASMNLIRMQIFAAVNEVLLAQDSPRADHYAELTEQCIAKDAALITEYHQAAGGKWDHMMSSKHIGFVNWNDEGSKAPEVHRIAEVRSGAYVPDGRVQDYMNFTEEMLESRSEAAEPSCPDCISGEMLPEDTFVMQDGIISMEAEHFAAQNAVGDAEYVKLHQYGRTLGAIKAFPVTENYLAGQNAPSVTYRVWVPKEGTYSLTLYLAPGNPSRIGGGVRYGLQAGDGMIDVIDSIPEGFVGGDCYNWRWSQNVLDNIRYSTSTCSLIAGLNTITIYAVDAGMVLQKLVLCEEGVSRGGSYLGPMESYRTK